MSVDILSAGGQSPGARYQQLAANSFPAWLLAYLSTQSQHFSRAQHLSEEHLGHLRPHLRRMRR